MFSLKLFHSPGSVLPTLTCSFCCCCCCVRPPSKVDTSFYAPSSLSFSTPWEPHPQHVKMGFITAIHSIVGRSSHPIPSHPVPSHIASGLEPTNTMAQEGRKEGQKESRQEESSNLWTQTTTTIIIIRLGCIKKNLSVHTRWDRMLSTRREVNKIKCVCCHYRPILLVLCQVVG